MKTFQLNAEPRTDLGKKAAKVIRKENKIPVVLTVVSSSNSLRTKLENGFATKSSKLVKKQF